MRKAAHAGPTVAGPHRRFLRPQASGWDRRHCRGICACRPWGVGAAGWRTLGTCHPGGFSCFSSGGDNSFRICLSNSSRTSPSPVIAAMASFNFGGAFGAGPYS